MPVEKTVYQVTEDQVRISAYICNVCGRRHEIKSEFDFEVQDFHVFRASGAFGTYYPRDMEDVEFVLCGKCLFNWTKTFLIEPSSVDQLYF